MGQIFQNFNTMADNIVGLLPLDMRDETYPAGIMFKLRIV
jgi:hypothetical protein